LQLTKDYLRDAELVKALDKDYDAHIDVLLGKDLAEASRLLLHFCVLLLKLAKFLEGISHNFIDKHCTGRYEEKAELLKVLEAPPFEAVVFFVFSILVDI
jgi:hypothetical protein